VLFSLPPDLLRLALSAEATPAYYTWLKSVNKTSPALYGILLVVVLMASGLVFNKLTDLVMMLISGLQLRLSKD
jgi:hypothetical protein